MKKKELLRMSLESFREAQESISCCNSVSDCEMEGFWHRFEDRVSSAERYETWSRIKGSGYFVDEVSNFYSLLVGGKNE